MPVKNFFSGVEGDQHYNAAVDAGANHVLMSFLYLQKRNDMEIVKRRKRANPNVHFLIDSGAHTFQAKYTDYLKWSRKDFEDYCEAYVKWLKDNKDYIFAGVELDIDYCLNMVLAGNSNSTVGTNVVETWQKKYFIPLEERGLPICYVWHKERKLEGWEEMCAKFAYVGLPGEFSSEADFNKYMTVARRYTTKVHGFAATKQADFRDWPWACMTDKHEILTKRGWLKREEVNLEDYALTYLNGKSSWERIEAVPTYDVNSVPITEFNSRTFSAQVTANHKWVSNYSRTRKETRSFEWRRTDELNSRDAIPRRADHEAPKSAIYSDAFVELVAWCWTEGHFQRRKEGGHRIIISQSLKVNAFKVRRIRQALHRANVQFCEWFQPIDDCVYFQLSGTVEKVLWKLMPDKEVPLDFLFRLTSKQLKLFVYCSVIADGTKLPRVKTNRYTFCLGQKNGKNLEMFELACILSGYAVSRHKGRIDAYRSQRYERDRMEFVSTSNVDWVYPWNAKKTEIKYTGKLWCITVKNHSFLTRCKEKVYWTGNSIDSTTWKSAEMYGTLIHWDERKQILVFDQDKSNRAAYREDFEKHGLDAEAIIKDTNYKEVTKYALVSMCAMEKFYAQKYSARTAYYERRLPHPKRIESMPDNQIGSLWLTVAPKDLFRNHAGEFKIPKLREYLTALAAVQYCRHDLITIGAERINFLGAYFSRLVTPTLADPEIFQKELSAYMAPLNPPALMRTDRSHYIASNNQPKSRLEKEIKLEDLEYDPASVPVELEEI